jgi:hypothetical protein
VVKSLLERVRFGYEFACRKHNLADDPVAYANDEINRMSNVELLDAISDALDEWYKEKEDGKT